ncbi:MAG: SDR family oxidoreductase [Solirubrobacterales bacterium]|nr:SDR family oxidoreductase [Solirubrobacterales bacterium]
MTDLRGRSLFISGASRGIGLAIAVRAARDGANIAFLAKTDEPDPRLPGTVHTAAAEIEAAGGQALPIVGDVRDADAVRAAVDRAAERFGGIDACVNNASVLNLSATAELAVKRFDLMQAVNARGTFVLSQACLPHLRASRRGQILTLSPPLNLAPRWLGAHPGYMLAKYGMTLLTLGFAAELADDGVRANCLWPRTIIATAAVRNLLGGDAATAKARSPEIVADAAHAILCGEQTGQCVIDDEVLGADADLEAYRAHPEGDELQLDIFLDP